jgi:hypothetical protein
MRDEMMPRKAFSVETTVVKDGATAPTTDQATEKKSKKK